MMLEVHDLHAFYGKSHILQGVDLRVDQGEIVSLLGRNGVGRSTACKTIMGLVPPVGKIGFKGNPIAGLRPDQIAHLGIGYVPEDRQVFPGLTVRQNLELGLKRAGVVGRWKFEDVFALFPNLAARQDNPAGVLSGGEQQMLTMCRTLMGDPDLVIIDEPTEGLAPKLVEQVGTLLDEIAKRGTAILLVEQKLTIALKISRRLYVMAMAASCSRERPLSSPPMSAYARSGWRFKGLASQAIKAPKARTRSNAFVAGVAGIGHIGLVTTTRPSECFRHSALCSISRAISAT
jgi:branched-chain amino acid transport system ATP-binding protein